MAIQHIPEDAWVQRGNGKAHRVFSSNFDILTQCSRWLNREGFTVIPAPTGTGAKVCWQCWHA